MAVIVLASLKGAPGVTTTALALGAVWPRPVVVVELDPAGGDISAQFLLPPEPGIVSLAASLQREESPDLLAHAQTVPGGLSVVLSPGSPVEAGAAVEAVAAQLPRLATLAAVDVLADCGRLSHSLLTGGRWSGPGRASTSVAGAASVIAAADSVLIVTRSALPDLQRIEAWRPAFAAWGGRARIVVVGGGAYGSEEISAALDVTVGGVLPHDPTGAAIAQGSGRGRTARVPLFRAARTLADGLLAELDSDRAPSAARRASPAAGAVAVGSPS